MFAISLIKRFEELQALGLVRSKRDFARLWLGRGATYLRDYEHRYGRTMLHVSPKTAATLRSRLCAVARHVPRGIATEIIAIVDQIDGDYRTAEFLRRQ